MLLLSTGISIAGPELESDAPTSVSRSGLAQEASPPDNGEIPRGSAHEAQLKEQAEQPVVVTEDALEAQALEAQGKLFPLESKRGKGLLATEPDVGEDFIVFGYLQSEDQIYHTRWQGLTHVGCRFVYFDSNGNLTGTSAFTGRSSYLKAGGAAAAAGVKVILVVTSFDDDPGGDIEAVMTSSSKRAVLIQDIVNLLEADSYSHGVSMDLEFSWGSTVRDGITAFMSELRTALDNSDPSYELSIYTNAIFSSSQWDFDASTGITPHIDYMTYSMYDWASGNTPHAISDFNNCLGSTRMQAYLNDGLPPEKFVPTISAYSRRWTGTTSYDVAGSSPSSQGFTDALYDTTLNPNYSGPYTNHYVTGDEGAWYTWNTGSTDYTVTWDSPESMEYKIRHALSMQDPTGVWNGRRLGGVGFWSLRWMAETSSYDPRTSSSVSRTRTYPHIYQLCQEILAAPGVTKFLIEGYEGLDYRWRDPNESPDTTGDTDSDSSRSIVTAPGGSGAPSSTVNAMQVVFDFEGSGTNRAFFGHEVLASNLATSVPDIHAVAAHFDSTTKVSASLYTASAYSGYQVRMMVMDADGDLELSDPYSLNSTGWRTMEWDLTDSGEINAYTTSEPAFNNGDGTLDTAGDGARDIGFIGFLIEGSGAVSGTVVFDEIAYEHQNPDDKDYVINEFRYNDVDSEFVEIQGPAGTLPSGFQLRFYDSSDGSVAKSVNLGGQTVPNDGGGYGFFVVGDSGVSNVDYSTGFSAAVDDIANIDPSAIQLYSTSTGCVYDSVVYEAFGGLDDLIRQETHGVTGNGYPWLGQIAGGTDSSSEPYTKGRYPDGANTWINSRDFSFMAASPGAANGNALDSDGWSFSFSTAPSKAFQTFQSFSVGSSGVGSSPGGGNVHRCVDTSGGGVISVLGDAALGSEGKGYRVEGQLYLPTSAEPAQAIAVGLCGSQGSTFFTTDSDGYGYENGYWLIYENASGIGLADGRTDHPGVFEFVHATHDNRDGLPVELLGSKSRSTTGASEGAWTTFLLEIDPLDVDPDQQLIAQINGTDVYRGSIPDGGPTLGAFQVGFRENHTGTPVPSEGTWIDTVAIVNFDWTPTPTATPTNTPTLTPTPTATATPTPPSLVWVDFDYSGTEKGTELEPYNTLVEGVNAVQVGGTVKIKTGDSTETLQIDKEVRLESDGGQARIGIQP